MSEKFGAAIAVLETLALRAWPALDVEVADGWLLRASDGFTKRANSVNALKAPVTPLMNRIERATTFYRDRDLPLLIRVTPLCEPGLDDALNDLNFQSGGRSHVMVTNLDGVQDENPSVILDGIATDAWRYGFLNASGLSQDRDDVLDRMLGQVAPRSIYASIGDQAFGRAVVEAGYVGLFSVAVSPDARRQGLAGRINSSLMAWGRSRGARRAYLQVEAHNEPAISLYRSVGFREAYSYHFRGLPKSGLSQPDLTVEVELEPSSAG